MRIRMGFGIHRILLFSVILFYSSECLSFRVKYFALSKNYHTKIDNSNSNKLTKKLLQYSTEIASSNQNYLNIRKSLIQIYKLPFSKHHTSNILLVSKYIPKGYKNQLSFRNMFEANIRNILLKTKGSYIRKTRSVNENNSERLVKPRSLFSPGAGETLNIPDRKKRESSSVAETAIGGAKAGSITNDNSNAVSKAVTQDGTALARSYAKGGGLSKAQASAQDMGDATAIAKAKTSNSSSSALGQYGGNALAAAESEGEGHADALAQSRDGGGSTAVVQVENGNGVATAVHTSDDPDFDDTKDSNESEEKMRPFQMGRTMGGDFSEEDDEIFKDKFIKTGQVKKATKKRRKEGRKKEKKFRFAKFVLR